MIYTIEHFDKSILEYIKSFDKIIIYGFGNLGKNFFDYYKKFSKTIIIVDKNLYIGNPNIISPDDLVIKDSKTIIINTILNTFESIKVYKFLKNKAKDIGVINCNQFITQSSNDIQKMQILNDLSSGYLSKIGYLNSCIYKSSIDNFKNPIPWVTYPFIDFIENRLNKNILIFEYGAGNSTLWYSKLVHKVFSIEHNIDWFNNIKNNSFENILINHIELDYDGKYCRFIHTFNLLFNIVIVDGRDRVNCLIQATKSLRDDGVIVLDDSEREQYKYGVEYLLNLGFKKIDFWGIAPSISFKKCTSIFYKNNNCLGI